MDVLARGFQSYLTIAGGLVLLALVWGANRYLSESTTAETGWPVMVAIAVVLVVLIVCARHLAAQSADRLPLIGREPATRDWNSRKE